MVIRRAATALAGVLVGLAGCHLVGGYDDLSLRTGPRVGWVVVGEGEGSAEVTAIGALTEARLLIAGSFDGKLELAPLSLDTARPSAAFIAVSESDGTILRALTLEATGGVSVLAASASSVVGVFGGSLAIGDAPLVATAPRSLFLLEFDPVTQDVVRTRALGGSATIAPEGHLDVAADSQGNLLVGGSYTGELALEGCAPRPSKTKPNMFLAKLAASDRRCLWTLGTDEDAPQRVESVAIDQANDFVVVGGVFVGELALDPEAPIQNSGGRDAFLARLDGAGRPRWVKSYGNGGRQGSMRVAAARGGYTAFATFFEGTLDLDGAKVTATTGHDVLLANLRPDGTLAWHHPMRIDREPCDDADCVLDDLAIAFDSEGNLLVAGPFKGTFEVDGVSLVSDADATFLAKFDRAGHPLWVGHFDAKGDECQLRGACSLALALDSNDDVIVGSSFTGRLAFGGTESADGVGPFESALDRDAYVVKFAR